MYFVLQDHGNSKLPHCVAARVCDWSDKLFIKVLINSDKRISFIDKGQDKIIIR